MSEDLTVLDIASFFKNVGTTERFDVTVPMPDEYSDFTDVVFTGKMRNTAGAVTFKATVCGTYKTVCDRCCDDVVLELKAVLDTIITENESKDDSVTVENGRIDLVKTAYDALSLEIPLIVHCSEDCRGICQGCGANLNREECRCADSAGK